MGLGAQEQVPDPCQGRPRCPGQQDQGCLLRQGWGSCKAAGAPPVWRQWRGQPARGRAGVGTVVALRCPGSVGNALSPLQGDQVGFPLGIRARAEAESVAAWLARNPAAPSSTPAEALWGLCCAGPARARGCWRRFNYRRSLGGCWSCRKR